MGISWRAMPLLSTLAALVIIVHSAEDGPDQDYRFDLRPRLLDTGTPTYDQPWRAVEEESRIPHSTQLNAWQESPEEPLKRRRPVRKRKRRPIASDELVHQETRVEESPEIIRLYPGNNDDKILPREERRYHDTEEPIRYRDTEYVEPTSEMPRRRRKRPENRRNRWTEEYIDIERPLRRRGQRRKRPSVEGWPKLSEFDEYRPNEESRETIRQLDNQEEQHFVVNSDSAEVTESYATERITERINQLQFLSARKENYQIRDEDKSLSEFSVEMMPDKVKQALGEDVGQDKIEEKTPLEKELNKKLDNRPIDPIALKEILKRSNGTSLSEILQQHNMSLSDLLYGKEEALALLKTEGFMDKDEGSNAPEKKSEPRNAYRNQETTEGRQTQKDIEVMVTENTTENSEVVQTTEVTTNTLSDLESQSTGGETTPRYEEVKNPPQSSEVKNKPKISNKRRFNGVRRKLRMRPVMNNNYKGQLNRDLMALTARKYKQSRNVTKSKEWKYVIPLMNGTDLSEDMSGNNEATEPPLTTTSTPDETTILHSSEYYNPTTMVVNTQTDVTTKDADNKNEVHETTLAPMTTPEETTISEMSTTTTSTTTTSKPRTSRLKPGANRMGLRRQAFNNRLKRKRMKQKNSTTQPSVGQDLELDLFGMPNLVSSSEFIARTQTPKSTNSNQEDDDFTTLDDFITTESPRHVESGPRFTRNSSIHQVDIEAKQDVFIPRFPSTTEETAKFEIEEILNDTRTSARLSRILMERNMTLNELVEHRERGSSHVHLADIFHNASKEPNPPEPFLSKSLIEPISKETYPLRALLEANLHDPKATTIDPSQTQYINIPVVMDFGNNVNENGENMGIMSLFNQFTDNDVSSVEKTDVGKDSEGTPYVTTVIALNNTHNETTRESRVLKDEENNLKHDIVGWNDLFELMRRTRQNFTDQEIPTVEDPDLNAKLMLQDSDGDGLIALDDLENLKDIDKTISLQEGSLHLNNFDKSDMPVQPGILDKAPSNTRSVTVATASIVGLTMVLFLLTYATFKWKQQRNTLRKKQSFNDERIPTPVFENRKSHKNNCSTRSISPMLATSNIYTMNTLDSNTGKESPDYMWDSLRKPFQ